MLNSKNQKMLKCMLHNSVLSRPCLRALLCPQVASRLGVEDIELRFSYDAGDAARAMVPPASDCDNLPGNNILHNTGVMAASCCMNKLYASFISRRDAWALLALS